MKRRRRRLRGMHIDHMNRWWRRRGIVLPILVHPAVLIP
jgi:hypothetical protein